jgi:hypothetical protein
MFNFGFGLEKAYIGGVNKRESMTWDKKAADLGNDCVTRNYEFGVFNGFSGDQDFIQHNLGNFFVRVILIVKN